MLVEEFLEISKENGRYLNDITWSERRVVGV